MVTLEALQTLLTFVTLISVPVGVFYHIMTLRNTRKNQELQLETRQAQLFMEVYRHYTDRDWLRQQQEIHWLFEDYDSYDEFMEKYSPLTNMEGFLTWNTRVNFYEGLGMLVKRGLIDPSFIDDSLSGPIVFFWEKRCEPIVHELREHVNNPAALEWVEYLYNEVKQIRDQQHPEYSKKNVLPEEQLQGNNPK